MNSVQCKLSLAQIVTLCPDFGDKMADKIDDLTKSTPKISVNSVSVAWHLPVQIHGQNLAALLDTGSALTLIGEACARRLRLKTIECRPLIMKMANDTRAIATQYLPTAMLTIGELDIPARIIVMPNVTYDLLLGKDFLTATQASIGMNKDTAHATLTWAGQQQTFNLTDDPGEYGLTMKTGHLDTVDPELGINQDSSYTAPRNLMRYLFDKARSCAQTIFQREDKTENGNQPKEKEVYSQRSHKQKDISQAGCIPTGAPTSESLSIYAKQAAHKIGCPKAQPAQSSPVPLQKDKGKVSAGIAARRQADARQTLQVGPAGTQTRAGSSKPPGRPMNVRRTEAVGPPWIPPIAEETGPLRGQAGRSPSMTTDRTSYALSSSTKSAQSSGDSKPERTTGPEEGRAIAESLKELEQRRIIRTYRLAQIRQKICLCQTAGRTRYICIHTRA